MENTSTEKKRVSFTNFFYPFIKTIKKYDKHILL